MLPLTRSRNRSRFFGIPFSPSTLFQGGTVAGAWYDPSDLSTMFTTSAGTTPVAMPGLGAAVPVGLMLDKSQGLVLGPELVTDGTQWTPVAPTTSTWTPSTSTLRVTGGASGGVYYNFVSVSGTWYKLTFSVSIVSAGTWYVIAKSASNGGGSNLIVSSDTITKTVTIYFLATSTASSLYVQITSGGVIDVTAVTLKALPGNHAIAFNNTTARPELRARVNLLTYSEDFSQGVWTKGGVTVNTGGSVQQLVETAANGLHRTYIDVATTPGANVESKLTALLGYGGRQYAYVQLNSRDAGADVDYCYAILDLTTGLVTDYGAKGTAVFGPAPTVVAVANNLWQISYTGKVNASSAGRYVNISLCDKPLWSQLTLSSSSPSYSGSIANSMYVGGIDLRPANIGANVPAYQRIADANTYNTSGFPLYLRFDGIDDSMYTPANLNLSGTDKVAVFAGVRKLSQATGQQIAELGNVSAGGWYLYPGNRATATGAFFTFLGRGTASDTASQAAEATPYAAPISAVLAATGNISGDSNTLSVNAAAAVVATGDQGAGNYSTNPLYIGSRANSSLWLNGHLYSLAVVGSAVSAGNIAAMESWVAGKTGIAI